MRISQLIESLEAHQKKMGDVNVHLGCKMDKETTIYGLFSVFPAQDFEHGGPLNTETKALFIVMI